MYNNNNNNNQYSSSSTTAAAAESNDDLLNNNNKQSADSITTTSWKQMMLEMNNNSSSTNNNNNNGSSSHNSNHNNNNEIKLSGSNPKHHHHKQKLSTTFLEEKKLQLFIPPRNTSGDDGVDDAITAADQHVSNNNSPTTTPSSLKSTPTTPNSALTRHLPPSQPRSLLQIHFKNNNSFSNVISQHSTTTLKSKPTQPTTILLQNNNNYTPTLPSHVPTPSAAAVRYFQNHSSPSLNTFILPPFVETKSLSSSGSSPSRASSSTTSNLSVSTCNILPHPFIFSSSYSRSGPTNSSSSNSSTTTAAAVSSPKVDSPSSLLYSTCNNSSIIKPFTFHFIKQKTKDNSYTSLNNEEIQTLEFIYKKRNEILASQLIPKMDQFFRSSILSRIQELLQNSVQVKLEENDMKRLDRIQHLLLIKKFILTYITEIENFTSYLNSPNMSTSKDDLKYLEEIEKSLNFFKIVKSDGDLLKTTHTCWKGTDDQFFQYITQLSASFCTCCNKQLPYILQKCINYFSIGSSSHSNGGDEQLSLKKVKLEDQKTNHTTNKFLTFTQIKKETYEPEAFSDFFDYD